jgi:2-(1,2-epoxy-1,2-dihydrophenyl)acetyl-CoA isomerase
METGRTFSTIRAEVDDGLATLTLARPDAGNAIDLTMAQELGEVTTAWATDPGVRAVLLQAEGRSFCVGGDVKGFAGQADLPAHLTAIVTHLHAALLRLTRMPAPVVAAVQGSAAGGGLGIALAADLVLVGASARFVVAFTAVGLSPDSSSSWSLPRLVGLRRALDLALTNRPMSAEEAVAEGLASRVVADDELAAEARQLARTLADGPTGALGATKRLLRGSLQQDLEVQLELEAASLATAGGTADGREGIAAFVEKRPPRFTGDVRW